MYRRLVLYFAAITLLGCRSAVPTRADTLAVARAIGGGLAMPSDTDALAIGVTGTRNLSLLASTLERELKARVPHSYLGNTECARVSFRIAIDSFRLTPDSAVAQIRETYWNRRTRTSDMHGRRLNLRTAKGGAWSISSIQELYAGDPIVIVCGVADTSGIAPR